MWIEEHININIPRKRDITWALKRNQDRSDLSLRVWETGACLHFK